MDRLRFGVPGGKGASLCEIFLGELACSTERSDSVCGREKFHRDIAGILKLAKPSEDVGIIDFARSGFVAAGNIGNVDQADEFEVFIEFGDEIALGNLLVEKIVKESHARIIDLAN